MLDFQGFGLSYNGLMIFFIIISLVGDIAHDIILF